MRSVSTKADYWLGQLAGWRLVLAVCLVLALSSVQRAEALPPETLNSVVSVLPEWPGRAQGGTGGPPGVAPEGSGIVVGAGVIATAWHVIEPAVRIDVRLSDGRVFPARLISQDIVSDIALISVDATLPVFQNAPAPQLTDQVCAIGNAFGLGLSITCGVVSARAVTNAGFNPVEDFIQTDAAINPGASGGALVDRQGRLVGMISAIFATEDGNNTGVSFAVSSVLLHRVTDALLAEGEVRYPVPGWQLNPPDRAQLAQSATPVVAEVTPGGAAEEAGTRAGDRVLRIGDRHIRSPRDAIAAFAIQPHGAEAVAMRLLRDGVELEVALSLETAGSEHAADPMLGDCPYAAPVCLARQAVFPISSYDPLASATRIGPDLLVTNRHVLGDHGDAVVHTPNGPRGARVVPSDYPGDLILLEVEGLPNQGHILPLSPALAEEFYTVGADTSRQEIRVFAPGRLILGPADGADLGRLHVSTHMQPGVSGGALVDNTGALAGIAVGGGEGRFEAIPAAQVTTLLDGRNSEGATTVTQAFGRAFAACDAVIESATETNVSALAETCAAADNHGQLLKAGRTLARLGAIDEAIALHRRAVEQTPHSINARLSLAASLQLGARYGEIIEHARWLIAIAPEDPQALRIAIQAGVWGDARDLTEDAYSLLQVLDPRQATAARRFIDSAPPAPSPRH